MSITSALKTFFLGGGEHSTPSLLLDRHGKLVNRELAAAFTTLLIDIALCDEKLQETEVSEIVNFLTQELALSDDTAQEVMTFALDSRQSASELSRNLGPIALALSDEQREYLFSLAVRVALADERVSEAEEQIVLHIAQVLHLTPEQVHRARGQ